MCMIVAVVELFSETVILCCALVTLSKFSFINKEAD